MWAFLEVPHKKLCVMFKLAHQKGSNLLDSSISIGQKTKC